MNELEFAHVIEQMTNAQFEDFLDALPDAITEDDKRVMIMHRGLMKLHKDKAYRNAMCQALGEQLYTEFTKA